MVVRLVLSRPRVRDFPGVGSADVRQRGRPDRGPPGQPCRADPGDLRVGGGPARELSPLRRLVRGTQRAVVPRYPRAGLRSGAGQQLLDRRLPDRCREPGRLCPCWLGLRRPAGRAGGKKQQASCPGPPPPVSALGWARLLDAALLAVVVFAQHLTVRGLRLTAFVPGGDVVGLHARELEMLATYRADPALTLVG